MPNVHLDTDFGGDPDDFAALLMLLGMPAVRLSGITTVLDATGHRAGAVHDVLNATGTPAIPLRSGARLGLTTSEPAGIREDFWPDVVPRLSVDPEESIMSLRRSLAMNSVVALIGPYTNVAMLRRQRDEMLNGRRVVHMGGFIDPVPDGYPQWTAADDFNIQFDTRAAEELYRSTAAVTMVPMPVAMQAWITTSDLDRIASSGPLGAQLARQLRVWGDEQQWQAIGREHAALPDDLAGIMWDPVTALIATGWEGATIEHMTLAPVNNGGILHFERDSESGRAVDVVTVIDTRAFRDVFVRAIENAHTRAGT
jgi:purine nucleosidase